MLTTMLVATLPGCCFDRCFAKRGVYSQPTAQIVQPPLERCLVNCPVDKDVCEVPAYVTPQDGVPGSS